jgi:hypothetical protein
MAYADLLKDPRWQKKRLQIMERDKFTCRSCGDTKTTLNVHHAYYEKGKMPWDYPDESLVTWCEECHERRQKMQNYIMSVLNEYTMDEFSGLHVFLGAPMLDARSFFYTIDTFQDVLPCLDVLTEMVDCLGSNARSIMNACSDGDEE